MLETIGFIFGFAVGSMIELETGIVSKTIANNKPRSDWAYQDLPTNTGNTWIDEQNAKLNKIKMCRIGSS